MFKIISYFNEFLHKRMPAIYYTQEFLRKIDKNHKTLSIAKIRILEDVGGFVYILGY